MNKTPPQIRFVKAHPEARLPAYKTAEAAGADVTSVEALDLAPGQRAMVATGLKCSIPPGWEIQVRCRSGLAANHGIAVLNGVGTIDSDYTGELKVILFNAGDTTFHIVPGERIAQLVVAPVWQADFGWNDETRDTARGAGGFGSTGRAG